MSEIVSLLLVSANIGSIFEFPDRLFPIWINNVIQLIDDKKPLFIGIHFQEVGGKNYEESMQHVDSFMKLILTNEALKCFDKARIYLDDDISDETKFTALGSLYFIHESISDVELWDFKDKRFNLVSGREVFSANIEHITHKYKEKFPLEFFPEMKWSRKGFMHTRWKIFNDTFDFVNIHLFHDICNMNPIIKNPRLYADYRKSALDYTIGKVTDNQSIDNLLFLFGDFNFRLNTSKLIQDLIQPKSIREFMTKKDRSTSNVAAKSPNNLSKTPTDSIPADVSKIVYKSNASNTKETDGDVLLQVARKQFELVDDHNKSSSLSFVENYEIFRKFDEEFSLITNKLFEFPIMFPPSYPFSEELNHPRDYMNTRCPSWCDRVLMNHQAHSLIIQNDPAIQYDMIGLNECMGDHKPIYLSFKFTSQTFSNYSNCSNSKHQSKHQPMHMKHRYSIIDAINGTNFDIKVSPNICPTNASSNQGDFEDAYGNKHSWNIFYSTNPERKLTTTKLSTSTSSTSSNNRNGDMSHFASGKSTNLINSCCNCPFFTKYSNVNCSQKSVDGSKKQSRANFRCCRIFKCCFR